ncbi:PAR3L protein, partial [Nothoprocta ornata]|nr:PAR3L protein [Nothoprocta ornata]
LIAVYDEQEPHHKIDGTNGTSLIERNSPDPFETEVTTQLTAFRPGGGEIEVTPSALKL